MKKISYNIRIPEISTFTNNLVRLYLANVPESEILAKDQNISSMMSEAKTLSEELTVAINRDRAESSLKSADKARDALIRGLSHLLLGYAQFPVAEKRSSAERLLSTFQKYGRGMIEKTYSIESALIESLFNDLSAESAKADLETLEDVGKLVSALRAAEDKFHEASDAFTAAVATKGRNATEIKQSLLELINERVVSYLSALEKTPGYADFVSHCAVEVNRANAPRKASGESATPENAENSSENGENGENSEAEEESQ